MKKIIGMSAIALLLSGAAAFAQQVPGNFNRSEEEGAQSGGTTRSGASGSSASARSRTPGGDPDTTNRPQSDMPSPYHKDTLPDGTVTGPIAPPSQSGR